MVNTNTSKGMEKYPLWKLGIQGSLGVVSAAWALLYLLHVVSPMRLVALGYALLTTTYVVADGVKDFMLGIVDAKVVVHHLVMVIFPWVCVFASLPGYLWYMFMVAGSTELGVSLFYLFLRNPVYRVPALLGLVARTSAVVEDIRVLIANAAAFTTYPALYALLVLILVLNQYYTVLFFRKYLRETSKRTQANVRAEIGAQPTSRGNALKLKRRGALKSGHLVKADLMRS